jgi:hypothetical protein
MPLLPFYGNLGENNDSIFEASRNVARTSLANIQPPDSIDAEFVAARKSTKELSAKFLEFKSLVSNMFHDIELIVDLGVPNDDDEAYEFLYKIKFLNSSVKKATLYFRINIKPEISSLDGTEISELNTIQKDTRLYLEDLDNKIEMYKAVIGVNYGKNSWVMILKSIADFAEQLAIAINSYRQNEPGVIMTGAGRNFYGKKINPSADIPTIWSSRIQSCPTKYLL